MTDRNFTTYNPQVVRDDVFMLGIDGTVKKNRMAVIRSSSAVVVSSQNANREWVYSQQQTVTAEGYSGQAFNPHFPHTTSGVGTTKNCTDCHLSKDNDNNAWMTQLLGFGTGTVNFFGRYAYVGEGREGLHAVIWTEPEEPQAAIGSHLHKIAYPDNYRKHLEARRDSQEALSSTAAQTFTISSCAANISTPRTARAASRSSTSRTSTRKDFRSASSARRFRRSASAPMCDTKYATSVALPSTLALDPARVRLPENEEQPIDLFYAFVYVTDREEGLVGRRMSRRSSTAIRTTIS